MSQLPDQLGEVDRLLRAVRFEPRESLGAELLGRFQRGEGGRQGSGGRRWILGVAAALVMGIGLSGLWLLAPHRVGTVTVDRCCQDLDGGGQADDGLMVVTGPGNVVRSLIVYEDLDGSRTFSPGDVVRFRREGKMVLAGPIDVGTRTIELCCLDYDGGGRSDDALVIVGRPPDRISLAAIYERYTAPGEPVQLR